MGGGGAWKLKKVNRQKTFYKSHKKKHVFQNPFGLTLVLLSQQISAPEASRRRRVTPCHRGQAVKHACPTENSHKTMRTVTKSHPGWIAAHNAGGARLELLNDPPASHNKQELVPASTYLSLFSENPKK